MFAEEVGGLLIAVSRQIEVAESETKLDEASVILSLGDFTVVERSLEGFEFLQGVFSFDA